MFSNLKFICFLRALSTTDGPFSFQPFRRIPESSHFLRSQEGAWARHILKPPAIRALLLLHMLQGLGQKGPYMLVIQAVEDILALPPVLDQLGRPQQAQLVGDS